jgi:hypothetical protein
MPRNLRALRTEASSVPQRAKLVQPAPTLSASPRHSAPDAIVQRALAAPQLLRPADLMVLQRTLGNRAVGALLGRQPIQAKLIVNAPGDQYEREADRVAEQVMRMPAPPREELEEDKKREIMTQPVIQRSGDGASAAGGRFEQQLDASRGRGQPLPSALQTEFEAKFGVDFSGVKIHTSAQADGLNRSIQAEAFTRGRDIYVAGGQFGPNSMEGKRLLAHELTHVVQQNSQWSLKARRNQGRPVISQLDNEITIQRRLKTTDLPYYRSATTILRDVKGSPTIYSELRTAFERYKETQTRRVEVPKEPQELKAALRKELEALQMIEVLANEWVSKRRVLDKETTKEKAKLIRELMSEVKGEFDRLDIQKAGRDQYFERFEDTQVLLGNMAFFGNQERKPFRYLTAEGLKATDPFDYAKPAEAAEKTKKAAEEAKEAAEETKRAADAAPNKKRAKKAAEEAEEVAEEAGLAAQLAEGAKEEAEKAKPVVEAVKKVANQYEITSDELFAIRVYTSGDYKYINPVLVNDRRFLETSIKDVGAKGTKQLTTWAFENVERNLDEKASRRGLSMDAMQHSRRALAGLAKLPDAPPTETYRGLALTPTELDGYKKGNKAPPWAAFSSTSTNRGLAEGYAKEEARKRQGKVPVLMISIVTQGKDIQPLSLYGAEREILVLPGAEFTVTQDPIQKNGVYEVHQRQTAAPGWDNLNEELFTMLKKMEAATKFANDLLNEARDTLLQAMGAKLPPLPVAPGRI